MNPKSKSEKASSPSNLSLFLLQEKNLEVIIILIVVTCALFSIFDPHQMSSEMGSKVILSFVFIFLFLESSFFPLKKWSLSELFIPLLFKSVALAMSKYRESFVILFSLFLCIFSSGILGMTPYSFAVSSHLAVTLSLSLPLWISGEMKKTLSSLEEWLAHFLPVGSPLPLWPLLVLIELVSSIIRPFTLAIRLMANVSAGHLTLSLLSSSEFLFKLPSTLGASMLVGFELCISIVQAFVFFSLLSLYWGE